ncbi:lysophospholipid acyltransferase family protein [Sphingomonas sp. AOB5]|uniref:lysophospholipid acyltransferase family protein n=1 Tax=Sphingomonas sp. AOB5 TaxID=3034017 RepID=UPI0023F65CCF|nr:lysophospholipid acyltransferase family protein [Sphingomonas sp. AOB5]MDF7774255.1 lysophospholipid acyltransferase family protein [Sphingomonas sp. AOB5]
MDLVRTIAFSIFFYGLSVPIVLLAPVAALFGSERMRAWCNGWAGLLRWSARNILKIDQQIVGEIPPGPFFFAAKHESLYEAIELTRLLKAPATVMKRELASIPVWGWAARSYGVIVIDRAASATALRGMMKDAKQAVAEGRPVLIFPEGTRVPVGEAPDLVAGFAGLYRMMGIPVIPVAVKSGHVWPKGGVKHPGTVTFVFGEPIPPGLPREEIEARVHAAINALNV